MDSSASGQGIVAACCDHGNGTAVSVKYEQGNF